MNNYGFYFRSNHVTSQDKDSLRYRPIMEYLYLLLIIVVGAGFPVLLYTTYLFILITNAWPAIKVIGFNIFINLRWNPVTDTYGTLTFLYGTLATSFLALLISTPLSVLASVLIYEYLPVTYKIHARNLIDLLASIPSIIYGLWGVFFLIPFLESSVYPVIQHLTGIRINGYSIFTAGILLAIMISPIIINITIEGFETVSPALKEAMYSLGGTRWEVTKHVTIGTNKPTIFVGIMLALGRSLGETMAVIMVIGNNNNPPTSLFYDLFNAGQTISSLLANEFSEASGALYLSALFELALILFIVTNLINFLGSLILRKMYLEVK